MNLLAGQEQRHRGRGRTCGHGRGRGRWDDWEIDTLYTLYTLLCEKQITSGKLGEGNDTPLQYSCLENPMDGGAWWAAVRAVAQSRTRLSNFTYTFHFHFSLSLTGEGNGNPLQCSCLENSRDGEAWWAAVYGVAQSRT